ncbi:signal peptidase II [Pseudogemmobacter sonorensis]|uniref:signal peptidase II n=1 Tax=Pseudogemmobacter sonorensis TaxID=2989681 RepID=UPI003677F634
MRAAALTAAVTFALDQVSKIAVVHGMELIHRGEIAVWPPFLVFRMAWNRGVNFGLFSGDGEVTRWIIILVSLVISVWVWIWLRKSAPGLAAQVSGGLLVGGALGNVIDRLRYGAVADFLNMSCCGIDNPFAFNVADIAIFAGAAGLVLFAGKPAGGSESGPDAGAGVR